MINYETRSQISQAHRTYIRENLGNIRDYTLDEINRFLSDEQEHMEALKHLENFRVEVYKRGKVNKLIKKETFKEMKQADVFCDRLTEYGENLDPKLTLVVYQAEKLIKALIKGDWHYPKTSIYE